MTHFLGGGGGGGRGEKLTSINYPQSHTVSEVFFSLVIMMDKGESGNLYELLAGKSFNTVK